MSNESQLDLLRQALYALMCCVPDSEGSANYKKEIVDKIREELAKHEAES